jgi:hypothetical protein
MPPCLMLVYSANLRGRLDALPRLFSRARDVRTGLAGWLTWVDLGGACAPEAWECAATQGRAGLMSLEAAGCAAAWLTAADGAGLDADTLARLRARASLALAGPVEGLADRAAWRAGPWTICLGWSADADLSIGVLDAEQTPRWEPGTRTVWLAPPPDMMGQPALGRARIAWEEGDGRPRTVEILPALGCDGARPDATVAAAIEFVREEARHYQQARLKGGADHAAG